MVGALSDAQAEQDEAERSQHVRGVLQAFARFERRMILPMYFAPAHHCAGRMWVIRPLRFHGEFGRQEKSCVEASPRREGAERMAAFGMLIRPSKRQI